MQNVEHLSTSSPNSLITESICPIAFFLHLFQRIGVIERQVVVSSTNMGEIGYRVNIVINIIRPIFKHPMKGVKHHPQREFGGILHLRYVSSFMPILQLYVIGRSFKSCLKIGIAQGTFQIRPQIQFAIPWISIRIARLQQPHQVLITMFPRVILKIRIR